MKSPNISYMAKLDHLRFLAALLVVFYHCYNFFGPKFGIKDVWTSYPGFLYSPVVQGYTGVTLFMMLSGFIFTLISNNKDIDYKNFFLNRLLRIYPLYALVILIAALLSQASLEQIIGSFLFLQENPASRVSSLGITEHLWTIAVEFKFYLLFPLLLIFMRRYGVKYFAGLIGLIICFRAMIYFYQPDALITFSYMSIFGRLDQFLIGSLLAVLYLKKSHWTLSPLWMLPSLGLLGTSLWIINLLGGQTAGPVWIIWPAIEALAWAAFVFTYIKTRAELPSVLSRTLAYLGAISFSLYVNHWFFIIYVSSHFKIRFVHDPFVNSMLMGITVILPLTVALSTLTYFLIEYPFMNLRKRYTHASVQNDDSSILPGLEKAPLV